MNRRSRTFLRGETPAPDRFRRVAPVSLRRRWLAVLRTAIVWWLALFVGALAMGAWLDAETIVRGAAIALAVILDQEHQRRGEAVENHDQKNDNQDLDGHGRTLRECMCFHYIQSTSAPVNDGMTGG